MKILENGAIYLEKGEAFPVWCACDHVYAPKQAGMYSSVCPKCGAHNIHHLNASYRKDSN